jgi:hypothetical protein
MGLVLPLVDYTTNWGGIVQEAVSRWNAKLAYRDITLTYSRGLPGYADECQQGQGSIRVCDSMPRVDDHLADSYVCAGTWTGSYIRFYTPPTSTDFSIAEACHELGHALMLSHNTVNPSVMTPVPSLAFPSSWDAAAAMPGYPLPAPPPPAPAPKKKKHKKKGGGKH